MKQDVVLVGALDFPNIPQAGDTVKIDIYWIFSKRNLDMSDISIR